MQPMNLGKVICFAYSDSSVDYRDRATMSETFNDGDLNRVSHLSQIGFSYTEDEPCRTSHSCLPCPVTHPSQVCSSLYLLATALRCRSGMMGRSSGRDLTITWVILDLTRMIVSCFVLRPCNSLTAHSTLRRSGCSTGHIMRNGSNGQCQLRRPPCHRS
jgi:hypothetical protein